MEITVKLFASLREGRFKEQKQQQADGTTILNVVDQLNIPYSELGIIFLNGKHAQLETELKTGDVLAIFPPVGGG
jgi:molybdopterin synthase sulfur carrier subunit